jgi:hypothetical protein
MRAAVHDADLDRHSNDGITFFQRSFISAGNRSRPLANAESEVVSYNISSRTNSNLLRVMRA